MGLHFSRGANRISVIPDLTTVTTFDPHREARPQDVGLHADAVNKIWTAVENLYRTGLHPGIALTVRRHGKVILDRSIGHARGNAPSGSDDVKVLMTPQTPICLYSASKAITAMLMHKLVENGLLNLDARVAEYLPAYGCNGKEHTTLRQLLSHRAGIPAMPLDQVAPEFHHDFDFVVRLLCGAKATDEHWHTQSYHAITAGYIIGEIVRRISGKPLRQMLQETFADPLGCEYFTYGIDERHRDVVAEDAFTGPNLPFPINRIAKRALYMNFEELPVFANSPAFQSSINPAANIYSTADESCRFYQMLLNDGMWDGQQVLHPQTITSAVQPVGPMTIDRTLFAPVRFSPAFVLGEKPFGLYGRNCPRAFGHLGFMNTVCWADPDRDLSVALITTGKSIAPDGIAAWLRALATIAQQCPPTSLR